MAKKKAINITRHLTSLPNALPGLNAHYVLLLRVLRLCEGTPRGNRVVDKDIFYEQLPYKAGMNRGQTLKHRIIYDGDKHNHRD